MFHTGVPILDYCSGVWRYSKKNVIISNFLLTLCKMRFFLGAPSLKAYISQGAELGHMLLLNTNMIPHMGKEMHASHTYNPVPSIALKG